MNSIFDKVSLDIINNDDFKKERDLVFIEYVNYLIGEIIEIDKSLVKKIATVIQIFYKSKDVNIIKEGSVLLAMLLDVASDKCPELIPIARHLFINSGDFPNVSLLNRRFPNIIMNYGLSTDAEFSFKEQINSVKELDFPLTDYQRMLWESLDNEDDVITIAPTSAGKTHIILSFIVNKILKSEGAFGAIIVPTRALISEVSGKVYEIANSIDKKNELEICTIPKDEQFSYKTIFVMTQERLYELTQRGDLSFDYLFIDEAHNISDQSRGVLLHLTLDRILDSSTPQIIISMPSEGYKNVFDSVFNNIPFQKEITRHSPISKIYISVNPLGRNLELSRLNFNSKILIPKKFTGKKLSDIVIRLGHGQSNIIYRNQTDHCENIAKDISDAINEDDFVITPILEEAANYIESFIHKEFTLANCLRKGVAFHYGPLPSSVRVMIENLVKSGHINYIACTSTLAEGVNLPAKNLFLKNPIRTIKGEPSQRLDDVKISNITGRAGRMIQHFSGNIFLIEHDDWKFKDYFDTEDLQEEKIPTYYKTLNDDFDSVLQALSGLYPHTESEQYRFYTIANKLIKDFEGGVLDEKLNSADITLSMENINNLKSKVNEAYNSLIVAPFTLEANPTVGYIQQNKLFEFISELVDYKDWLIPHPQAKGLYDYLVKIAHKLKEFGIYINLDGYTIEYIMLIATKWLLGKSLKEIITEQISWDVAHNNSTSINQSVRNVIKVINNDITFRFKNAISCYHLLLSNQLKIQKIERPMIKLHTYIEIGACEDRVISLINIGLSRESALEISRILPKNLGVNSLSDVLNYLNDGTLETLHQIIKKEIQYLSK